MKIALLATLSICALSAVTARAIIVVPNDDFESQSGGVAADWTVSNPPATDTAGEGVGGSFGEVFGPGMSKITEKVDLGGSGHGPLVTYQVTFSAMDLITDPATFVADGQFEIKLDGADAVFVTVNSATTTAGYAVYTADFTTDHLGLRPLSIKWTGTADTGSAKKGTLVTHGDGLLDDISISVFSATTPVPEPATWIAGALLLLPFGLKTLRTVIYCKTPVR